MESPEFREGDRVLFFPTKGSHDFEPATVVGVYPAGIPSCPQPMLKISSRAGVVLASHCRPSPVPLVAFDASPEKKETT